MTSIVSFNIYSITVTHPDESSISFDRNVSWAGPFQALCRNLYTDFRFSPLAGHNYRVPTEAVKTFLKGVTE